ncbi:MAG: Ig-like domain-containing protein [Lacipirellulaceae bacterium]
MSRRKHNRRPRWRPRIERLEERYALDGAGALLGADGYMTLSFAPDGTSVAGQASTLDSRFGTLASQQAWQDTILRAFQTWAVHTSADVGLVADSGDPLGSPGATRRDARFGDIRIAGIAMAPEIGAISVPITSVVSGTWHADIVFNTAFPYQSLDDVFAIALHEAGNVFGLLDNNDPNSPMKAGPIPTATVPTAADIAALQALHGVRAPDLNELDDSNEPSPNNTRASANEWEPGSTDGGAEGSFPALAIGDVQNSADVDYFALETPDAYSGPVTFRLRTDGISVLRGKLTIEDGAGVTLATATGLGDRGGTVSVTLPSITPGATLYARIEGAPAAGLFGVGGYALVARFDGVNTVSEARLLEATDGSLRRLELDDLDDVFDAAEDYFRDDLGVNDSLATATPLADAAGFATSARYETLASVGTVGDVDYYRLASADPSGAGVVYVALRATDRGRLVPAVQVLDALGQPVASRVLVNGAGELLVEADLSAGADLYLRVAAADGAGPFQRGNYALSVGFGATPQALATFASGTLATLSSRNEHTVYVAEPQLLHLALEASLANATGEAAVVAEVRSSTGAVVYRVASKPGSTRSAGAVFLPIGQYTVVVWGIGMPGVSAGPFGYALRGAAFSDPFVGDGSDPTTNPFTCGSGNPGFYCYPGDIVSSDPFLWEDFVQQLPTPPPTLPLPETITLLLGDWWRWAWGTFGGNGPPLAQDDSYSQGGPPAGVAPITAPRSVLTNDIDPTNDPIVAILESAPTSGSVSLQSDGKFTFVPAPGFSGAVTFTYRAFDFVTTSGIGTVTIQVAPPGLPGDYSNDGVVDQADYDVWVAGYGGSGGPADGNRDGFVNAADYAIWRDNLGRTSPPALALLRSAEPPAAVTGNQGTANRGAANQSTAPERSPPIGVVAVVSPTARTRFAPALRQPLLGSVASPSLRLLTALVAAPTVPTTTPRDEAFAELGHQPVATTPTPARVAARRAGLAR